MQNRNYLRGEGAYFSETLACKVSKATRERIRIIASRGGATESALLRALIESGLDLFDASPRLINPIHKLLLGKPR